MVDPVLIKSKLARLTGYVAELEAEQHRSREEFLTNHLVQRFAERNIQLAAEEMAGICRHIVSTMDLGEPETYGQCFEFLARAGIVRAAEAEIFRKILGFRNLLVHMYSGVDAGRTFDFFQRGTADFRNFVRCIEDWLESL